MKSRLVTDVNTDLNEYFGNIAELGRATRLEYDISPPTADDVQPATTPAFPRLRALIAEGSSNAIVGKLNNSLVGLQPQKRKAPATGATSRQPASRPRTTTAAATNQSAAPPQTSHFQQELNAHWKGQQCLRSHCGLNHTQVHPNVRGSASAPPRTASRTAARAAPRTPVARFSANYRAPGAAGTN